TKNSIRFTVWQSNFFGSMKGLDMKTKRSANFVILTLALLSGSWCFAPFQVGNGGDYLRIIFEQARERGMMIATKLDKLAIERLNASESVRTWIRTNHKALAGDLG